MNIYMAVTNDKYELPVAFGETLNELARMVKHEYSSRTDSTLLQQVRSFLYRSK